MTPPDVPPTAARRELLKFAYWVPNVSGGLVVSNVEQRTDWSYEYNVDLARAAEAREADRTATPVPVPPSPA